MMVIRISIWNQTAIKTQGDPDQAPVSNKGSKGKQRWVRPHHLWLQRPSYLPRSATYLELSFKHNRHRRGVSPPSKIFQLFPAVWSVYHTVLPYRKQPVDMLMAAEHRRPMVAFIGHGLTFLVFNLPRSDLVICACILQPAHQPWISLKANSISNNRGEK